MESPNDINSFPSNIQLIKKKKKNLSSHSVFGWVSLQSAGNGRNRKFLSSMRRLFVDPLLFIVPKW